MLSACSRKKNDPPRCNAQRSNVSIGFRHGPYPFKYKGRFKAVANRGQISRKGGDKNSVRRSYCRSSDTEIDSG